MKLLVSSLHTQKLRFVLYFEIDIKFCIFFGISHRVINFIMKYYDTLEKMHLSIVSLNIPVRGSIGHRLHVMNNLISFVFDFELLRLENLL